MRMVDIIEKKKNKGTLTRKEIRFWIEGLTSGSIPDYQSSALAMAIVLIIESFRPAWNAKLAVINTILALLFFTSAVLVLLTKELFLQANEWGNGLVIIDGETVFAIRNGGGPVSSAICSAIAGIILLVVTWMPRKRKEIDFIEK